MKEIKVSIIYGYDWYSTLFIRSADCCFENIKTVCKNLGIEVRDRFYDGHDDNKKWTTVDDIHSAILNQKNEFSVFNVNNENGDLLFKDGT